MARAPKVREHRATPEFAHRLGRAVNLQRAQLALMEQLEADLEELARDVCEAGDIFAMRAQIGDAHCPDERNPAARCVYDVAVDPACDVCLFCGEPHERK